MSREVAFKAMDFLSEASGGRCTVTFFGGEPLTEFDLLKRIVEYGQTTHEGTFQFRMSTNGTLLSPEVMDWLGENEVYFVLSLDGDETQHDLNRQFRGGGGSHHQVVKHLPRILEMNPYTLAVSVVAPNTAGHLARGVRDLFSKGFRYVLQTLDYSAPWGPLHLKVLEKQYRELAAFYAEALTAGKKIYYSPFDERIKSWAQKPYGKGDLCDLANTQIAIASSGRLFPCVQFIGADDDGDGRASIGNVVEGFVEEKRQYFVEENLADKTSCAGCELEGRCATFCGCVNWRATGDLKTIPAITCEHERMLMPIVDKMASELWRRGADLFKRKFYDRSYPVSSYLEDCRLGFGEEGQ